MSRNKREGRYGGKLDGNHWRSKNVIRPGAMIVYSVLKNGVWIPLFDQKKGKW